MIGTVKVLRISTMKDTAYREPVPLVIPTISTKKRKWYHFDLFKTPLERKHNGQKYTWKDVKVWYGHDWELHETTKGNFVYFTTENFITSDTLRGCISKLPISRQEEIIEKLSQKPIVEL